MEAGSLVMDQRLGYESVEIIKNIEKGILKTTNNMFTRGIDFVSLYSCKRGNLLNMKCLRRIDNNTLLLGENQKYKEVMKGRIETVLQALENKTKAFESGESIFELFDKQVLQSYKVGRGNNPPEGLDLSSIANSIYEAFRDKRPVASTGKKPVKILSALGATQEQIETITSVNHGCTYIIASSLPMDIFACSTGQSFTTCLDERSTYGYFAGLAGYVLNPDIYVVGEVKSLDYEVMSSTDVTNNFLSEKHYHRFINRSFAVWTTANRLALIACYPVAEMRKTLQNTIDNIYGEDKEGDMWEQKNLTPLILMEDGKGDEYELLPYVDAYIHRQDVSGTDIALYKLTSKPISYDSGERCKYMSETNDCDSVDNFTELFYHTYTADSWVCVDCGEVYGASEANIFDRVDNPFCESCAGEHQTCDNCGDHLFDDEGCRNARTDEIFCESCLRTSVQLCGLCHEPYKNEDLVDVKNKETGVHRTVCGRCAGEHDEFYEVL